MLTKAGRVIFPQTYFGMDVSAVEDPVQRRALETMIKTYGQTPRQLFNASHLSRAGPKLLMEGELPAAMGLLVQLAFRETREQAKEIVCPVICQPPVRSETHNTYEVIRGSRGNFLFPPLFAPNRAHCRGSKA